MESATLRPPAVCATDSTIATASAAMEAGDWAAAAELFLDLHRHLGPQTPGVVFSRASTCLHRLGRYDDAERLTLAGLGPKRDLVAHAAPPLPEAELTRTWPRSDLPVVSIVCTTYNHERYIESALRGFFSQRTQFPFEVLIHDDASTDGTAAIIRRWQDAYPALLRPILQTENQYSRGIRPFEIPLARARGKYVATCEGDDYWRDPSKLQRQIGFLEQHPDFSCSAHNYYLLTEAHLSVRPWLQPATDRILTERQLMNVTRLLWLPTLVFRRMFSTLPPERALAPIGDQFLTSYLGTFGKCAYFETFLGAVRRENQFSQWTPLSAAKKESIRVKTWLALVRLHQRLGHPQTVADLNQRIAASPLPAAEKAECVRLSLAELPTTLKAANE